MVSKNFNLREIIEAYVVAALEMFSQRMGNRYPAEDWSDFPAFPFIFMREELEQLPEYEVCLSALKNDSVIFPQLDVMVGIHIKGNRSFTLEELMVRLIHLGVYKNALKFNKEYFEREYVDFEGAFYDGNFKYEVIAPLFGPLFKEPLNLSEELEICRVNQSDLSLLTQNDFDEDVLLGSPLWAIRTHYTLPKIVGDDVQSNLEEAKKNDDCRNKANERIEQLLTCLRLFGVPNVYALNIIHRTKPWLFHDVRQYQIKYLPSNFYGLELGDDFTKAFKTFWHNFQAAISKYKIIALAAKRFSYAHERHDWEDRIIDLLIASEAIFLSQSGKQGELKYRLRLQAAMLLGQDSKSRRQIFDDMGTAYDLRSSIVHGNSDLEKKIKEIKKKEDIGFGEEYKLEQFTNRIQRYIQFAICKMIQLATVNNSQKELINWEDLILGKKTEEAIES